MAAQGAGLKLAQSWRWGVLLLCSLSIVCLHHRLAAAAAAGTHSYTTKSKNWDWVGRIADMEGEELTEMLSPLLEISLNDFLYPNVSEVKGWRLSPLVAPLTGAGPGVRGLVYEEDDVDQLLLGDGGGEQQQQNATTKRAVLCFHGMREEELADWCASMMLTHGYSYSSLPSECIISFSESTLDYLSEAVAYVSRALLFYPSPYLLISGDSFGSGLAILAAASLSASTSPRSTLLPLDEIVSTATDQALSLPLDHQNIVQALDDTSLSMTQLHLHEYDNTQLLQAPHPLPTSLYASQEADEPSPFPVLVFSAVGTREALCQRGLPFPSSSASLPSLSSSVVVIAHQWDYVVRSFWNDQVGLLCLYEADEIDQCKACAAESPPAGEPGSPATAPAMPPSPTGYADYYCSWPEEPHPPVLPEDLSTDCRYCATHTHLVNQLMALVDQGVRPTCKLMLVA